MTKVSRRRFLRSMASGSVWLASGCQGIFRPVSKARVVVIGGGFGGATAAKTLRSLSEDIHVTLVEPKLRYFTCPGSNWLFAGLTDLAGLIVDYQVLKDRYGVELVSDSVVNIDRERRRVRLLGGQILDYDRLIFSPGIDFRWDAIEGYDRATSENFPHAWQAGPQTLLLAKQLQSMPDGGVILIAPPPNPYRCPPGPYERASMMAYWLKRHKPRAKVLILDPKRSFSKQALFETAWSKYYGYGGENSLIEWHSVADNPVVHFDARSQTLTTEFGDRFKGDVVNIIPSQTAAQIARDSALTDSSDWCPVEVRTGLSKYDEFIHVIGDAAHYAPIPKSAFAANSEAKACAIGVLHLLKEEPAPDPHWLNTCYSLVTPEHGISVVGVYRQDSDRSIVSVPGAGGVSRQDIPDAAEREARYAISAYRALVGNSFG